MVGAAMLLLKVVSVDHWQKGGAGNYTAAAGNMSKVWMMKDLEDM